uniref:Uncharacterized protein n=1 Tax=Bubo bubo TaxID=30461 RepID=A0A8C0FG96_BUBBB
QAPGRTHGPMERGAHTGAGFLAGLVTLWGTHTEAINIRNAEKVSTINKAFAEVQKEVQQLSKGTAAEPQKSHQVISLCENLNREVEGMCMFKALYSGSKTAGNSCSWFKAVSPALLISVVIMLKSG